MFNYTTSTTPECQGLGDQTQHQRHLREQPSSTSCKTSRHYSTESHLGTLTVPIADWLPWNDLECTSAATCASSTGVSAPSLASNSVLKAFWECLPTQRNRRQEKAHEGTILPFVPESYSFSSSTPTSILKCARRIQKARNSSTVPWSKVAIWAMVIPCHPFVGQTTL